MKWLGGRTRRDAGTPRIGAEDVIDTASSDFSIDELREFLEADLVESQADPEFKERLRRRLWLMVQERARKRGVTRSDA